MKLWTNFNFIVTFWEIDPKKETMCRTEDQWGVTQTSCYTSSLVGHRSFPSWHIVFTRLNNTEISERKNGSQTCRHLTSQTLCIWYSEDQSWKRLVSNNLWINLLKSWSGIYLTLRILVRDNFFFYRIRLLFFKK